MTIYTILERLERLEKLNDENKPSFTLKERVEVLENQINNIAKTIGIDL